MHYFPMRRRRSFFRRSYFRRRPFFRSKPGLLTVNHARITPFATAAGVAETNTIFTCVSGPSNRGTHIPEGAVLKRVILDLWNADTTLSVGLHQAGLWIRPGGLAFAAEPITGWFATTDPASQGMIEARKYVICRPRTQFTVTGGSAAPRFRLSCKMNRTMRDGDDIVVASLDDAASNWDGIATAKYIL